jgi:hypothetical protein
LSQSSSRVLKTGFVVVAVLLLVVSLVAANYYSTSSSELSTKNLEILRLRVSGLTENSTLLQTELVVLALNSSIARLNSVIASLQSNLTASRAESGNLTSQIASLENRSALLSLQLSVVENVAKVSLITLFANYSLSVQPNSTVPLASEPGGSNGTIAFLSSKGCQSAGTQTGSVTPTFALQILLDSRGGTLVSSYHRVAGQPFTVAFKNVGPTTVQCTFSLFFVYTT